MRGLWIVVTRRCNLDCVYCYQGSHSWTWQQKAGLTKFMSDATMQLALDWAVDWAQEGKDGGLRITWYGGEPLLAKEFLCKWIPLWKERFGKADKPLVQSITTNGMLLDPKFRDFMDLHSVGMLLSLDGPPAIHNQQRRGLDGGNTWGAIKPLELLAWRPQMPIVWQLDPGVGFVSGDLDWILAKGFKIVNFNINWLKEWPPRPQDRLRRFMEHATRLFLQKKFACNFETKLRRSLGKPMAVPCGTGDNMLAVSPEGWLYPSQEMCFSVFEPGRAPGTAEYYRIGSLCAIPNVIDRRRLEVVNQIKTADMKAPFSFHCSDCAARGFCMGGCHCRYVGQDGVDPANRYQVPKAHCQAMRAAIEGMLTGAVIEGWLKTTESTQRIDVSMVYKEILDLKKMLAREAN